MRALMKLVALVSGMLFTFVVYNAINVKLVYPNGQTQELRKPFPQQQFELNLTTPQLNRPEDSHDLEEQRQFTPPPPLPVSQSLEHVPCMCVVNVSFIKIHRCGSGTFHNTLLNFAVRHNAALAFGNCNYYEVFPNQLSPKLLHPPPNNFTGYNMFIDHAIYNRTATERVLPKDTVYITQIRHPFRHALSAYTFMMGNQGPHVNYATFLEDPEEHQRYIRFGGPCRHLSKPQMMFDPSRNVMALELGYTNQADSNLTRFRTFLHQLDKELTHVSILEELPESLVLLKRKMCWSHHDILHLRLHSTGGKMTKNSTLLAEQQRAHERWSSLDYALYEFFLSRHKAEVSRQSADFLLEVEEHKRVQANFTEFCSTICDQLAALNISETQVIDQTIAQVRKVLATTKTFQQTQFYETFSVSYKDCVMHILDELESKKVLIYQMYQDSCYGGGHRLPALQCDTNQHVMPGVRFSAIRQLFQVKSCSRLKNIKK